MVSTLVSKCFGSPWLGHTIKQTMKIQTVDPDILYFDFLKKGSWTSFSIKFCAWFLKKNISHIIFYQLIKFHCLIAFISWDISKNVFVNCLLSNFWRHKLTKNSEQKLKYSRTKRAFNPLQPGVAYLYPLKTSVSKKI